MDTVYFEYAVLGNMVRVAAVDADSGVEVHVTGPRHAAKSYLEKLALKKLERKLAELSS